jgi:hypothetical protein
MNTRLTCYMGTHREAPQVAAGENPLVRATDTSQGRELTQEWGIKRRRRHTPILAGVLVTGQSTHNLYQAAIPTRTSQVVAAPLSMLRPDPIQYSGMTLRHRTQQDKRPDPTRLHLIMRHDMTKPIHTERQFATFPHTALRSGMLRLHATLYHRAAFPHSTRQSLTLHNAAAPHDPAVFSATRRDKTGLYPAAQPNVTLRNGNTGPDPTRLYSAALLAVT